MSSDEEIFETRFLIYYPDHEEGNRLLMVDVMYGSVFANRLEEGNNHTWTRLIKQLERTKRLYEANRNEDKLS